MNTITTALSALLKIMVNRRDNARHTSNQPDQDPIQRAYHQGKADAFETAYNLILNALIQLGDER